MTQLGLGVLIQRLYGSGRLTKDEMHLVLGQSIRDIQISENELLIDLENDRRLRLWDAGQSCCESRYMTTDDDLSAYRGASIVDIEVSSGPDIEDEYGESHDTEFLRVITNRGTITFVNHNQHNGYYGGFALSAELS